MVRRAVSFTAFAALVFVLSAFAQQNNASLSGTVTGPNGKPRVGARIYLQSEDGHPPLTVLANDAGQYEFAKIRAGIYDVRAAASGLASDLHRNVNVRAKEQVTVDLQLKPLSTKNP
jgi:hypothetical protein